MNIVHIIGNGFDLNLDLKTSYKDFYDYYIKINSKNEIIELLKREIKSNSENWSDLELALGKFTSKIKTVDEFEVIRRDIILNLSNYLKVIEDSFDFKKVIIGELLMFLGAPNRKLRNGDKIKFEQEYLSFKNHVTQIDTISFNYTSILDKLLIGQTNKQMSIANSLTNHSIIKPVKHIHGYLNERMIIGVNDPSQVLNEFFVKNIDFNEAFIKTEYNKAANHLVDNECVDLLNNANIICVFGSSLGLTDKFWWELICERLLEGNCQLIIYQRNPYIENNLFSNDISKEIRKTKNKFSSFKSNATREEIEIIKQNIYVNINSDFFKIV